MLEIKNLSYVVGGCRCSCYISTYADSCASGHPVIEQSWVDLGQMSSFDSCQTACAERKRFESDQWHVLVDKLLDVQCG